MVEEKKLYSVMAIARRGMDEIMRPDHVVSDSGDNPRLEALKSLEETYPESDGWKHTVFVTEVPRGLMRECIASSARGCSLA